MAFRLPHRFVILLPLCTLTVLTGCSVSGDIVPRSASGVLLELPDQAKATIELGKMGIDKAKEGLGQAQSVAGDLQARAEKLQKGIAEVMTGAAKVKAAVGR